MINFKSTEEIKRTIKNCRTQKSKDLKKQLFLKGMDTRQEQLILAVLLTPSDFVILLFLATFQLFPKTGIRPKHLGAHTAYRNILLKCKLYGKHTLSSISSLSFFLRNYNNLQSIRECFTEMWNIKKSGPPAKCEPQKLFSLCNVYLSSVSTLPLTVFSHQ